MRTYINKLKEHAGETITVKGWVHNRRDHGKLIFIDLRDKTGIIQMVALPNNKEVHQIANTLRSEWVVEIEGIVNMRPEKMVNDAEQNGNIEIEVRTITILNTAETPAITINSDGKEIGDEVRMKYRYLDLRRDRMQKNIRARHSIIKYIRDYLDESGFVEVETPLLTKSTPEGARDFIIPARLEHAHFYALPQSPQQYKQLLMASGIENYFQIAKCMRDEDTRGDRQPEFTQLDMEVSFATQEEIMDLNETLLIKIVKALYPHKEIQEIPFPRISYKEAMESYGNDRPDLRENKEDPDLLAFCWVVDFPMFKKVDTKNESIAHQGMSEKKGEWTFTHNPFSAAKKEHTEWLRTKTNIGDIQAPQYDIVLNGYEIGGGSIRNHDPKLLTTVFEILGYTPLEIQENFSHMLEAFKSGTPPHGGIAWGLDRLIMLLQNEPNIREVIAFPKTGEGKDLLMKAPSVITEAQLSELGISITKKKA